MREIKLKDVQCPACGNMVTPMDTKATLETEDPREILIEYTVKSCFCPKCRLPIYSKEVEAYDRIATGEALRKVFPDMLPLSVIRGLPKRYGISRKDFMVVMGIPKKREVDEGVWEDFKLFDGEAPDDALEARLQDINRDPKVFIEFLKLAQRKISPEAYEKSMNKALSMVK